MSTDLKAVVESTPCQGQVIGLPVHVGDLGSTVNRLIERAHSGLGGYVCISNVHMLVTARQDPRFREVFQGAFHVTSDGMPLVWSLHRQGFREAQRVAGYDLMLKLLDRAQLDQLPVFFYGGSPEILQTFQQRLAKEFPLLRVVGYEAPPKLSPIPEMDPKVFERIRDSGARLVFVGLGCPKQEFWMNAYAELTGVQIGVGAAFDFYASNKKRAPRWMQRCGLEWLYRLLSEPGRLWKRYLVTNTLFIGFLLQELFRKNLILSSRTK